MTRRPDPPAAASPDPAAARPAAAGPDAPAARLAAAGPGPAAARRAAVAPDLPAARPAAGSPDAPAAARAEPGLVYCRCAYARVVPRAVKDGVLDALAASGADFDAVPDLCEMSARRDPRLAEIAGGGPVTIAACYPRAVRWLFASAGAPLDTDRVTILNMREDAAETVAAAMLAPQAAPATPAGGHE